MNLFSEQIEMQNGCEDTMEEGEGGMNSENSNETYTLSYVKLIATGKLYNTGSSSQCSMTA